jgi:hypothetical protein
MLVDSDEKPIWDAYAAAYIAGIHYRYDNVKAEDHFTNPGLGECKELLTDGRTR